MSYFLRRQKSYDAVAVVFVLANTVGSFGCAGDPGQTTSSTPPATTSAQPSTGSDHQITGTAPIARDGSLTVVLLEPQTAAAAEPPEEPVQMDQIGQEFLPPVLLASVGQPVNFHNGEDVLHNVRVYNVDTKETAFNVSTPIGGTYEHRFDKAGTYRVSCDIHPQMGASVVVTMTPYATVASRTGSFVFHNVVPGSYTAIVHVGSERSRRAVTINADTTELTLN